MRDKNRSEIRMLLSTNRLPIFCLSLLLSADHCHSVLAMLGAHGRGDVAPSLVCCGACKH